MGDYVFEHKVIHGLPVLCIHRPMPGSFLSQMDADSDKLIDVDPDGEDVARFLYSTVVAFMNEGRALGVARGQAGGPRQGAVVDYLEEYFPQADGYSWKATPLQRESDLDRFRAGRAGVNRLEATVTTERDLFRQDEPNPAGIVSYLHGLSDALGSEVEVKLDIKLRSSENPATRKAMRAMVLRDLDALLNMSSTRAPRVTAQDDAEEEYIYLKAHPLASTIEITPEKVGSPHFSALVDAVVTECLALQAQARELL